VSLLSLDKYLNAPGDEASSTALLPINGYFDFAAWLMESISSGFKGEMLADLGVELEALRESLNPAQEGEELKQAARIFQGLWAEFRSRIQKADQERADDFRTVLSDLKETFSLLSSGTQGTDMRFQRLDESLQVATRIDDMTMLRTHLTQTLQSVRQEVTRERRRHRGLLDVLSNQIRNSQDNISRMSGTMSSREAAITKLNVGLQDSNSDLQTVIYVADILKRLAAVHGNGISDSLLDEFARQRLQPIALDGKIFRWSNNSVVLLCTSAKREEQRFRTTGPPQSLFEYQAFLGDRVAQFRVAMRSITLPLRGGLEELTRKLDDFAHVPRPKVQPLPPSTEDTQLD
jgi:hypothetical protein